MNALLPTTESRKVVFPYTGETIGTVPLANQNDVNAVIQDALDLFQDRSSWLPLNQRIAILKKAASLLASRHDELALLIAYEGGKPLRDANIEVNRAVDGLHICVEELRTQAGLVVPMRLDGASAARLAVTQYEPIGVVVAVSAFNHPLNLIVHQIAPAIATGCPVIVKPAEDTPLCAQAFAGILADAGLPDGWCQIVNTSDLEAAEKLVTDSRIGFFSFIGSARVGWMLRSKLAPGVRCALEHGGAAPAIVLPDADIEEAAGLITKGGFYHAGQVCVSVQRVFVDEDIADELVTALKVAVRQLHVGDPTNLITDVGPLIRPAEVDRVESWVAEAIDGGATVVSGGTRLSNHVYAPTLLIDPPAGSKIATQEVFGPVVAVFKTKSLGEAIARANDIEFGFQAAVFTKNMNSALAAYAGLKASAIMINDHSAFRTDWMPFAGVGQSGLGTGGIPHTMQDMRIEKMLVLNSPALATL